MNSYEALLRNDIQVPDYAVPETICETIGDDERQLLTDRIKAQLKARDAVLVAHYYTSPDLQRLAEESGGYVSDSLDMARFGNEHPASTLIVAGVRFMGETAKILNPEKRILMPDLNAECSLDLGCPAADFSAYCDQHPDRTVVVYANTSAEVKARADWMVTSGIALDVVRHLKDKGEKIIWGPDRYLGEYIRTETGADMLLWQGSCVVHEEFKAEELREMRMKYPDAKVLVHPESPANVVGQADVVGSTTALINAVKTLDAKIFIVATDNGIFHKMKQIAGDKILLEAPTSGKSATCHSCAHCPWMAMNGLRSLVACLENNSNEISVPEDIRVRALVPIKRLMDFAKRREQVVLGNNDA